MSRKALIVGIDHYDYVGNLYGCVADAYKVNALLDQDYDGSKNFGVKLKTASKEFEGINRGQLRDKVEELFKGKGEIALFYYSGHGYIDTIGGYLITSECKRGDDGLALTDVLDIANASEFRNKVIILDSCHSGFAGDLSSKANVASIGEGVTILTASSKDQYAMEVNGTGVFTNLLCSALSGGARDLFGNVTPGSVYSHIDQALGEWEQRPIFKTNVEKFVTLRKVAAPIPSEELKMITTFFKDPSTHYQLDPSYESDSKSPIKENTDKFGILQR